MVDSIEVKPWTATEITLSLNGDVKQRFAGHVDSWRRIKRARKGAGVDVNPIGANIGPFARCVTVYDDLAEILFVQEKILTNPE